MTLPWHVVFRPCGGCGELVDTETGCKHWRPEKAKVTAAKNRAHREKLNEERRNQRAMVSEFQALLGRQTT